MQYCDLYTFAVYMLIEIKILKEVIKTPHTFGVMVCGVLTVLHRHIMICTYYFTSKTLKMKQYIDCIKHICVMLTQIFLGNNSLSL